MKRLHADWLAAPALQRWLAALSEDGEAARVVGGAVRNSLLGVPVKDVDVATTRLPDAVVRLAEREGFKPVPTGIEHGTVTVVADGVPYETTTLRADIETDGRHARVAFGRDWRADAERRDFTINALYAEADGAVVDLVGGLPDIEARAVRFIGDADARIVEDYLRILRFFRFHAHYGRGRPDAEGLRAAARHKGGLERLSPERVWSELRRLLEAPDPRITLLWMRQTGVLSAVLPETERWGIDAVAPLIGTEQAHGWSPDPMLRLAAMVPPDAERMVALAERLRLSNAEGERLAAWASASPVPPSADEAALARRLYCDGTAPVLDRLRLALANARGRAATDDGALMEATSLTRLIAFAEGWDRPAFPLKGRDLLDAGMAPGPAVGERLAALEAEWIERGFRGSREEWLARLGP